MRPSSLIVSGVCRALCVVFSLSVLAVCEKTSILFTLSVCRAIVVVVVVVVGDAYAVAVPISSGSQPALCLSPRADRFPRGSARGQPNLDTLIVANRPHLAAALLSLCSARLMGPALESPLAAGSAAMMRETTRHVCRLLDWPLPLATVAGPA